MNLIQSINKIIPIFIDYYTNANLWISSGKGTFNCISGDITKFINHHITPCTFHEVKYLLESKLPIYTKDNDWYYNLPKNGIFEKDDDSIEDLFIEGSFYIILCNKLNITSSLYTIGTKKSYHLIWQGKYNGIYIAEFYTLKDLAIFNINNMEIQNNLHYNKVIEYTTHHNCIIKTSTNKPTFPINQSNLEINQNGILKISRTFFTMEN